MSSTTLNTTNKVTPPRIVGYSALILVGRNRLRHTKEFPPNKEPIEIFVNLLCSFRAWVRAQAPVVIVVWERRDDDTSHIAYRGSIYPDGEYRSVEKRRVNKQQKAG